MRVEQIGNATLYLGKMEETIDGIQQVDHILADPPYLYIKTHDFDKGFDEQLFFRNAKRFLPDDGFIALFGRGTSFYRWNTRLADLGFIFKEEIVWDKRRPSSPCLALSRIHETISLHTKKTGKIRRSKVPYVEQKQYDIDSIADDIKRIKTAVKTDAGLNTVLAFLHGKRVYTQVNNGGLGMVAPAAFKKVPDEVSRLQKIKDGMREKTIIEISSVYKNVVHPTQKPVRLAERILALISDPGDTIYDPFMGSGSFAVACISTGRKYVGSEEKPEYLNIACKRIEEAVKHYEQT